MNYGLPYTGSKNRIAKWLIERLPSCEVFVDVFCGGCAVSDAMMRHNKAKGFILNDLQGDVPKLFVDALKGDLDKYHPLHWVSREQFFAEKATNPFIRLVYSFGQIGDTYLYSKELEPYKRAIHYAIVEDEWSEFDRLCPEVCSDTCNALKGLVERNERRLAFQRAVASSLKGLISQNPYYSSPSTLDGVHAALHLERTQRLMEIQNPYYSSPNALGAKHAAQHLQNIQRIKEITNHYYESHNALNGTSAAEHLERTQRLVELKTPRFPSIQTESKDYRDLVIPEGVVVFCDPPYKNSKVKYDGRGFDHAAFYDWCVETAKTHPLFITEYRIDDPRFVCIGEKARQISLNGTGSKGKKVERLYRVIGGMA